MVSYFGGRGKQTPRFHLSPAPCFSVLLFLLLVTNSLQLGGNARLFNEIVPPCKKKGNLCAKDYYSKAFLLLFFSIRAASVLDPNGELRLFKKSIEKQG